MCQCNKCTSRAPPYAEKIEIDGWLYHWITYVKSCIPSVIWKHKEMTQNSGADVPHDIYWSQVFIIPVKRSWCCGCYVSEQRACNSYRYSMTLTGLVSAKCHPLLPAHLVADLCIKPILGGHAQLDPRRGISLVRSSSPERERSMLAHHADFLIIMFPNARGGRVLLIKGRQISVLVFDRNN